MAEEGSGTAPPAPADTCPPGYDFKPQEDNFVSPSSSSPAQRQKQAPGEVDLVLLKRKAWEHGKSPLSNIFSTLLMMYFAGSHLSIVSLMLCAVMISGPIKSLMSFKSSFKIFDDALLGKDETILFSAKAVYLLINAAVLAVAIWKIGQLGLLPFTEADYLRSMPVYTSDKLVKFVKV